MRKALLLILFLVAWAVMSSTASAGLTTSLLSSQNATNDTIQDRSLGYLLDLDNSGADNPLLAASAGDIALGVIRIETINGLSTKEAVGSSKGFVYMVFSALLQTPAPPMDPFDDGTVVAGATILPHTWVGGDSSWSLNSMLGSVTNGAAISAGSIAALIETTTAVDLGPSVNFENNTINLTPTAFVGALGTAFSAANGGSVLATFGFDRNDIGNPADDDPDFYHLDPTIAVNQRKQHAGLSVIDSFVGPVSNWKLLNPDPWASPATHEIAIGPLSNSSLTDTGGPLNDPKAGVNYRTTSDVALYTANYVPEPSTIAALLGMSLVSGVGLIRRRMRKS